MGRHPGERRDGTLYTVRKDGAVRTGKTGGQTVHFDGQELSGNYQTAK